MPTIEEQEFTCPECGSHEFGTTSTNGTSTGYCHGYIGDRQNCGFSWQRSPATDELVFKGTGVMRPSVGVAMSTRRYG